MKITIKKEISVIPVLVKNSSKQNAERLGELVNGYRGRDIYIHDHFISDDNLLILVAGNVGNALENLLVEIAEVKSDSIWQEKVEMAAEVASVISEEKASAIIESSNMEYSDLDNDLTSIYS